ncbi:MAG: hypothetical protein ACSHYF_00355 [Verrucomicrobiaceae bacterium]
MKTIAILLLFLFPGLSLAEDPGKEIIGSISVEMLYATNGDPERVGPQGKAVSKKDVASIKSIKELGFEHYRSLGTEIPQILRGYESWATPLRPSKEVLVSFEPLNRDGKDQIQMVMEYWQSKRKLFTTNPVLVKNKPLYLLGPEWRGGRLILKVTLLELTD